MRRMLVCLALMGWTLAWTPPGWSAGLVIVDEAYWRPHPVPPEHLPPHIPPRPFPMPRPHVFAPLELKKVDARVRISDQLATTTIEQQFYNPNPSRLEGSFVFPVPPGAHIEHFTLDIDGKRVEAELLAADKARRIYEDIVRKSRDPALLEYAGRDLLRARVFPIEPNGTRTVCIAYRQLLKADDGLVRYTLPLSTDKFSPQVPGELNLKIDLETKRPLKSVYSPTHTVETKRPTPNSASVTLTGRGTSSADDFAMYFSTEKDEVGLSLLTFRETGEDGYFLLLASPGIDAQADRVLPKDVVLVLDTSGSMAGKKLEQAKKALSFCVENLNEQDRFEVIRFSTEVEPLFGKLQENTRATRERAQKFVDNLKPIGGTSIDAALKQALEAVPRSDTPADRLFVVIFLTDGRPTVGTVDEDQILANVRSENSGKTRVFCFGIGSDVNTHLLDKITEQTRAFTQYVLPEEDLELKVSSFFSKIKEPVLANPKLVFGENVRVSSVCPSVLPDLFKGEQLVVAGRYAGKGDCAITIEGAIGGKSRRFVYEKTFPESAREDDFLPRLWATRRVGYLLDEIRLHGENAELRDEVTELARRYGIVTPYTAYLIVEDEARRNVSSELRSLPSIERDVEVRQKAASVWRQLRDDRSGESGLAGARYGMALKSANAAPAATMLGAEEAQRGLGLLSSSGTSTVTSAPDSSASRLVAYSEQSRFAGGKTFFLNERTWVDSEMQKYRSAERVRLVFASPEFFALAAQHPEVLPWLTLGSRVQFVLGGKAYEVTD